MSQFQSTWATAALTSLGFFWMAFWAFCLGYLISSMIQVFVTEARMRRTMGKDGPRAVALASFFGFMSSSCSFAALSTTRALFQKGAGLVPSLAFLLASTNLVVELGILIFIFLSWQFVVGEYLGGIILILVMWGLVRLTLPNRLVERAREHATEAAGGDRNDQEESIPDWRERIRQPSAWQEVARRYFMEWRMVWKDVTFGFTVAGVIAAFVPPVFFETLFVGTANEPSWWQIGLHTLIGPLAAFFTFIGSMGNIPLASILFASGVSFAGVMAFIFSDLVVFPVLRISAQYFGWKMALYVLAVLLGSLVTTSLLLYGGFASLDALPDPGVVRASRVAPADRFGIDHTLFLNATFFTVSLVLATVHARAKHTKSRGEERRSWLQSLLLILAVGSLIWLTIGGSIALATRS